MSSDEVLVTVMAVLIGPVLWTAWLIQMSRVQRLQKRKPAVAAISAALAACTVLVFLILKSGASYDVRDAPAYLFMYVMLGLAWSRAATLMFAFAGLSLRDDVIERGNRAALTAAIGGLVAVTLCYAGGNVGDGPGWWVVVFSAVLSTATLIVTWVALTNVTPVADAVIIDRDPAAGITFSSLRGMRRLRFSASVEATLVALDHRFPKTRVAAGFTVSVMTPVVSARLH